MIAPGNVFWRVVLGACLLSGCAAARGQGAARFSSDANRLAYLDENDLFYPGLHFPRLTTPQWVGEPGVEAAVILAIDDLRETPRYETFLRPILRRLQQIDGRAPLSIMINAVSPTNAQLQAWLKEGVSLEVHTLAHPCPCLAKGDFAAAANTYQQCVDLLNQVPGNKPVAFRMPCCDSMNSPSPRFYAEIFNRVSPDGHFLIIDSSVMNLTTANDPTLPRDLVLDVAGRERFRKYLPGQTNAVTRVSLGSFTTTIEDYPYPYVIGKLCWELPAMVPSDWEAQNVHGSTNPVTLADWEAALDATVLKQGVFTFIFHPHGWSSSAQFVEFIDYAVRKHGKKVKFLNFREVQERLDRNLLGGTPLRAPNGQDNGVRLLDLNNDGFMDVVIGAGQSRRTRLWDAKEGTWQETGFPGEMMETRFGVLHPDGWATALQAAQASPGAWHFQGQRWVDDPSLLRGLELDGQPILVAREGRDRGVRLRDLDRDGRCELIVGNEAQNAVFGWSEADQAWKKLAYALPRGTAIVDREGRDAGLRFVDLNEDGYADVLFSDDQAFSLHLFVPKANPRLSWKVGWNDEVWSARREPAGLDIPKIVRGGSNGQNGVWFARRTMWIQNEDTANLPDKVDRRTFRQLLTADDPPALSAEQSLAALRVRPGFKVELVACEPLVMDPIAFEWGPDGRLWVVEMGDYPLGLDGQGKPGGRIKFLEDLDGDGRYDKATVFLEGVNFPTGVMPWREGVLVAAAPEIFYAEDTDGDGKADKRETLYAGFHEGNQQHRLNGFDYGLDNWVYGANGDSGGSIRSVGRTSGLGRAREAAPAAPVNLSGHDFRFRPDTGEFEAVEGQTQYGRHRDDWGNWFGNNNPTWLWHYHLPEHYLARNSHLSVRSTRQLLANYAESTRLYPASRTRQRFNDPGQFNHVTSANSPTPYRDELFGPDFASSVFISDPVHNVVHREILQPNGVTFTSHRAPDETNREFLASADNWFRPTMLKTGPDGALYIADMYRQVLEHPEWIPAHIQPRLDLRAGADQGRLYRVYPADRKPRAIPRLDRLDTAGLVGALDSPNGWQRDTAQRLLVHANDPSASAPLRKLLASAARPTTRLQALCTLEGLGAVTPEIARIAWADPHPEVRAHGLRASEPLFVVPPSGGSASGNSKRLELSHGSPPEGGTTNGGTTNLGAALLQLTDDPEIRVRYQLAYTLGEWTAPAAGPALVRLALRDMDNAPMQMAVLSSAPRHVGEMLHALLARRAEAPPPDALLAQLLGLATAMQNEPAIAETLEEIARPARSDAFAAWQFAAFAAFLDGLERGARSFDQFAADARPPLKSTLAQVARIFSAARLVAGRQQAPEADRLAAIRLLGRDSTQREDDLKELEGLLRPEHSVAIQKAAVTVLNRLTQSTAADALLAGWKSHSPALREEVLAALCSRPEWMKKLLTQIENETVAARQISPAWQQKLLQHSDPSVRERATKIFSATRTDRQSLLKEYAEVGQLRGDANRGRELFRQNCATCHRLREEGNQVGPDLGMIGDKSVPALLTAILDPNQAVETRYVSYTAMTKDDRELSGIMSAETRNSITLRAADGREETLLRSELKELTSSGLSLMPEGFEKALQPQDLADLLAAVLAR